MGSVSGDYQSLNKQLLLTINQLQRQVSRLSTDLLRYQLLAQNYDNYLSFLKKTNPGTFCTPEYKHFTDKNDVLNKINNCFVNLNDISSDLNVLQSIGCQTSDESMDVLTQQRDDDIKDETQDVEELSDKSDNKLGVECDVDWVSMNETIDGSVGSDRQEVDNETNDNTSDDRQRNGVKQDIDGSDTEEYSCGSSDEDLSDSSDDNSCGKRRKTSNKTHRSRYICDYGNCLKYYKNYKTYIQHRESGPHVMGPPFVCRALDHYFQTTTKEEFVKHVNTCKVFDQTLKYNCKLIRNFRCHHKDCNNSYISLTQLYLHYKKSNHLKLRWFCDTDGCSQHFVDNEKLKAHNISGDHTVGQPYVCWYRNCDFEAFTRDIFNVHTSSHSKDQVFKCDIDGCHKTYPILDELYEHKMTHTAVTYHCDVDGCGHTFKHKVSVENHKTRKHSNEYKCPHDGCPFTTFIFKQLNQHKFTHSSVTYECDVEGCGSLLKNAHVLNLHRARYHSNKYKCPHNGCPFTTGMNYFMKLHINSRHSNVKPFKCLVTGCDKLFKDSECLRKHRLRCHPKVSQQKDDNNRHDTQDVNELSDKSDNYLGVECDVEWISMNDKIDGKVSSNRREEDMKIKDNWQRNCVKHNETIDGSDTEEYSYGSSDEDLSDSSDDNKSRKRRKTRHKTIKYGYVCDYGNCRKYYKNNNIYKEHQKSGEHVMGPPFVCRRFDHFYETTTKEEFVKHVNTCKIFNQTLRYNPKIIRNYRCHHKDCNKSYVTLSHLNIHYKRSKHLELRLFCEANGCSQHFPDNETLKAHNMAGDHTTDQPFVCWYRDCNFEAFTRDVFDVHTNSHSKDQVIAAAKQISKVRQFKCDIDGCDKTYPILDQLYRHKINHSGITYKCVVDGCGHTFKLKGSLHRHIAKNHSNKYKCPHDGCPFTTGMNSLLKKHVYSRHSKVKPFKCVFIGCEKLFKDRNGLNRHRLRFHPEMFDDKPWIKCPHIDCQFKTKCNHDMKLHNIKNHLKTFMCSECEKCFINKISLKFHKSSHNEALRVMCEWPGCELRYANDTTMKSHLKTHSDNFSHRCQWPDCDKAYNDPRSLSAHVKQVHTRLGRFECHWPECDYSSTNSKNLRLHINKTHDI